MRESLGGAMLLNLVVIFSGIVIAFFIGILSYSKAYRVKNRIIEIIEKYEVYDENVANELNPDLNNAGYNTSNPTKCEAIRSDLVNADNGRYEDAKLLANSNTYGYDYCVFESKNSDNGNYYVVVTFVRFEFPVIGDVLTFPVYGETKILNKSYDY